MNPWEEYQAKPWEEFGADSTPPKVTASDRVQAVGSGANSGVAGLLGLPVDTGLNVIDLVTAGLGTGYGAITGKDPSNAFPLVNRSEVAGSSDWIRNQANKNQVTTTQMNRPDDTASQYLHTAGSALPGAMLMRPATIGQAGTAATQNVIPALAGKATQDTTRGTPYENTAPIAANLLAQRAVAPTSIPQKRVDTVRRQTLIDSQKAGYAVPPSTTNPTVSNKIMESFGGKIATQQDASAKNMDVTDSLARKALGLAPDSHLTVEKLNKIRNTEAKSYAPIKQMPKIVADPDYQAGLQRIAANSDVLAKEFPGLGTEEVGNLVKSLNQPQFTGTAALAATRYLRDKASSFYKNGDKDVGAAYRSASDEIEGLIERNLATNVQAASTPAIKAQAKKVLDEFRGARKQIAKTYSVEEALNSSTGNVSAAQLARQLDRGVPLEGELKTVAKFGQAFPKAARQIDDSGSVRNTDVIVGGGVAAMSGEPAALLYPFGRMAMRDRLLAPWGQRQAVPKMPGQPPLMSAEQRRAALMLNQGLLAQ